MNTHTASSFIRYFELLAAMTGIFCYYKNSRSIWFVFAFFLLFLFGFETLGHWFGNHEMYKENINLYKWIVVPFIFMMYHFCYYFILSKKFKPIIIVSYLLFAILALLENLYLADKHYYSISFTISYGCISILLFSLVYFYELVKGEEILNFKKIMAFWFCLALLIFWLGSFPELFFNNLFGIGKKTTLAVAYRWIFIFLNYIMYLLFTIGFICSNKLKP